MKHRLSGELQKDAHVLFSISIGQDKQTGPHFSEAATLLESNDSVKKITILKADLLQRHHLMISQGIDEETAKKLALEISINWEKENNEVLTYLRKKYNTEVLNWNQYLSDKDYQACLNKVKEKYNNESKYKREVDRLTNLFIKKNSKFFFQKNEKKFNSKAEFEEFCALKIRDYIFEECAISILLIKDERAFGYELYRNQRNAPMRAIHSDYAYTGRMKELFLQKDSPEKKTHPSNSSQFKLSKKNETDSSSSEEEAGYSVKLTRKKGGVKVSATIETNSEDTLTERKILNFSRLFLTSVKELYNDESTEEEANSDSDHEEENKTTTTHRRKLQR